MRCAACNKRSGKRSYCVHCWPVTLGRPPQASKKKQKRNKGKRGPYAEYKSRNDLLKGLGFKSYKHYLRSAPWAEIRERVLERDGRTCRTCGYKATQVHHGSYSRKALLGKDLSDLYAICNGCHRKIEFTPDGDKRGLRAVGKSYAKRRKFHMTERYFNPVGKDDRDELTKEFLRIVRDY